MDDPVRRTVARWQQSNAVPEPGASTRELASFEAHHGVRLPPAFAALWHAADGNHGDENLTRFWPLREIHRLTDEEGFSGAALPDDPQSLFVFADYLIFSHLYAVRLKKDGQDAGVWWVLSPTERAEIAPTFESFLRRYAADPGSILFPPELGQSSDSAL
jgi:hypothetical protein